MFKVDMLYLNLIAEHKIVSVSICTYGNQLMIPKQFVKDVLVASVCLRKNLETENDLTLKFDGSNL